MAEVISLMQAKIDRICTAERIVKEKLSRVLEHMNLSDGERAVAMNVALYRVTHGGHPATAYREGINYARDREYDRNRQQDNEWFRLGESGFVPAWTDPDGAA